MARWSAVMPELARHLPYTIASTLLAMAAIWWFASQRMALDGSELSAQALVVFHVFHLLHVSLSAIATTSLGWRYDRRVARAVVVGFFGAVLPCGLSDYFFPYLGGLIVGQPMEFHICAVEEPQLFFSVLALGIFAGFWAEQLLTGSHLFSHGAHIFVSSAASLLYLVSYGFTAWIADAALLLPVFVVIVLAVWVPCCISDIVIPVSASADHPHERRPGCC